MKPFVVTSEHDSLDVTLDGVPIKVWTFGENSDLIGVRLPDARATVHITTDPSNPDGLLVFTYGNVRTGN